MLHVVPDQHRHTAPISPLMLSDRLIGLAEQAESAGFGGIAEGVVKLACAVFETTPEPGRVVESNAIR